MNPTRLLIGGGTQGDFGVFRNEGPPVAHGFHADLFQEQRRSAYAKRRLHWDVLNLQTRGHGLHPGFGNEVRGFEDGRTGERREVPGEGTHAGGGFDDVLYIPPGVSRLGEGFR